MLGRLIADAFEILLNAFESLQRKIVGGEVDRHAVALPEESDEQHRRTRFDPQFLGIGASALRCMTESSVRVGIRWPLRKFCSNQLRAPIRNSIGFTSA